MIIGFSGCADSGKSTLISQIAEKSLWSNDKVRVKGDDDFLIIKIYKKLFGDSQIKKYNREKLLGVHITKPFPKLRAIFAEILYPIIIYLEYSFDYLYYEKLYPQKVLLKDRYIYDYLVTLQSNLDVNNKLINILLENFPRPTLLFYVRVTPETVMRRNKNTLSGSRTTNILFHRNVILKYEKISQKKKMIVIKNDINLDRSIRSIIWHCRNRDNLSSLRQISFSGLDGVGKTTLIKLLGKYLDQLSVEYKVLHFYHDTMVYKFLKLMGLFKENTTTLNKQEIQKSALLRKIKGKSLFWGMLNFLDAYLQYWLSRITFPNQIIIYDRYFYDFLPTFSYYKIGFQSIFIKIIPSLKYKFILLCSPNVIYKRKLENLPEYYNLAHGLYQKYVKKFSLIPLHTEKLSPPELLEKVLNNLYE